MHVVVSNENDRRCCPISRPVHCAENPHVGIKHNNLQMILIYFYEKFVLRMTIPVSWFICSYAHRVYENQNILTKIDIKTTVLKKLHSNKKMLMKSFAMQKAFKWKNVRKEPKLCRTLLKQGWMKKVIQVWF